MESILIVDDALVDRQVAAGCARAEGYQVQLAEDGLAALEQMSRGVPDVVLTDLYMPRMDGLTLITRIRADHPQVPVILMTGQGADDTAVRALRAGAASYIPKGVLKRHLGGTVRAVLLAAQAVASKNAPWKFLNFSDAYFVLGYEPHARSTMVGYFESELTKMAFCDAADTIRVGTALSEALSNAVDHGNLELDSSWRGASDVDYFAIGRIREEMLPYSERRVQIFYRVTPSEIVYKVCDEGGGFDYRNLPDPTDPENLTKLSGRGLLLIRTFFDDVWFNSRGNEITMVKRRAT